MITLSFYKVNCLMQKNPNSGTELVISGWDQRHQILIFVPSSLELSHSYSFMRGPVWTMHSFVDHSNVFPWP